MKEFLIGLASMIGILLFAWLLIFLIYQYNIGEYEYVDLDGNVGTSSLCYIGRGSLHCDLDHGAIQVKQYIRKDK